MKVIPVFRKSRHNKLSIDVSAQPQCTELLPVPPKLIDFLPNCCTGASYIYIGYRINRNKDSQTERQAHQNEGYC